MGFRRATREKIKARVALIGVTGSGKTKSALLIASALGERIAVIDSENNSACRYEGESDIPEFDVWDLENHHPETYIKALTVANAEGYDVVIVDSLSHAWIGREGALEQVDKAAARSRSGNSFTAWRDVTPMHNRLVDALLSLQSHLIVTMRAKTEYVLQEVTRKGKTVMEPVKVGLAPVQRDGLEYEFDIVADIDHDHRLVVSKSRCSALDGAVVVKPGAEFGQHIADWVDAGKERPADVIRKRIDEASTLDDVHAIKALVRDAWKTLRLDEREALVSSTTELEAKLHEGAEEAVDVAGG